MPDVHNKVVFMEGFKTILRPLDKERDLPFLQIYINHPEIRTNVKSNRPKTRENEADWYDRVTKSETDYLWAVEAKIADGGTAFLGTTGIHSINWADGHGVTGALFGKLEFLGKGYGKDAKMQVLNHAFNSLRLNRISSGVIEFNERSLRYLLRTGYKVEGYRRQHRFRQGRYWDEIVLGVLREEWLPIWEYYQEHSGDLPPPAEAGA